MKAVPLGSQNTVEFTASLPFSQHSLWAKPGLVTLAPDRLSCMGGSSFYLADLFQRIILFRFWFDNPFPD